MFKYVASRVLQRSRTPLMRKIARQYSPFVKRIFGTDFRPKFEYDEIKNYDEYKRKAIIHQCADSMWRLGKIYGAMNENQKAIKWFSSSIKESSENKLEQIEFDACSEFGKYCYNYEIKKKRGLLENFMLYNKVEWDSFKARFDTTNYHIIDFDDATINTKYKMAIFYDDIDIEKAIKFYSDLVFSNNHQKAKYKLGRIFARTDIPLRKFIMNDQLIMKYASDAKDFEHNDDVVGAGQKLSLLMYNKYGNIDNIPIGTTQQNTHSSAYFSADTKVVIFFVMYCTLLVLPFVVVKS